MKKPLFILMALAFSTAVCAQDETPFGKEDLLAAFKQYNPAALEKAAQNENYRAILDKLTAAYSAPRTEENEIETIALVLNFDNSIRLEALRQSYVQARTFEAVTGTDLQSLESATYENLLPIVKDIFAQTVEVKNIQIKRYKEQIKSTKKDTTLSVQEKEQRIADLKKRLSIVKSELRALKKNSKTVMADAAQSYLADIHGEYEAATAHAQKAAQSSTRDIKANNKKPVAK